MHSDPNHPGCARSIVQLNSTSATVSGADAAGGEGVACDGTTDVAWGALPATTSGPVIAVDFSSKGGPTDLSGTYSDHTLAIDWADGNEWTKATAAAAPPAGWRDVSDVPDDARIELSATGSPALRARRTAT